MKLTLKIAKYTLLVLAILLALIIAIVSFAVKTETGSRYVLSMIPGLTISNQQGTLSGGWSAEQLTWQSEDITVTVTNPSLNWYVSCLFKADVCIDKLTAKQVAINLSATTDKTKQDDATDNTPIRLPAISLPISIHINTIQLDKLLLNQQALISNAILTNTTWQGAKVTFDSLKLYSKQAKANVALQGNVELTNNWPVSLTAQANLDQLFTTPWAINLKATGEVQKQLQLTIDSNGYLDAKVNGTANVLDKDLPADLTLTIHDFLPDNIVDLPDSLLIKQLQLTAKGDLANGFKVDSSGSFAGHTTPVYLTLHSLLTTKQITLQTLTLNTTEQQFVTITGEANLQPKLQANTSIDYQQFPWQELYHLESPPPVDLHTLKATAQYQDDQYQAQLNAALTGPAGNFTVDSKLLGDLKQLTLETLQVNTPDKGNISGTAKVTFDPNISWLANLTLQNINPNYWVASLSGSLNGTIQSTGTIVNQVIETDSKLAIQGNLNKQPAQFKTHILAKQQQWQIPELLVQLGSNNITGQATIANTIKAELAINMPNLKQILPALAGSLTGKAKLSGTLEKPQATVNLTGQHLAFQQQRLQRLQLTANLTSQQKATLKLQANRLRSGTTQFGNLTVEGSGDIKQQQLTLQLTEGIVKLVAALNSQQDNQQNWHVNINKLQVASQGQDWQLQNTAKLDYTKAGVLTLNSHCFKNGQASLCAIEQQKLLPTQAIHYKLANFPMDSLKPWYPDNFNWRGILSANIKLNLPTQGPNGNIEINANGGTFQLRENIEENWHNFPYQTLSLLIDLTPRKVNTTLQFKGNNLGSLQSQISIDPIAANKPIQGNFTIDGLDISIFRPFIADINELTGKINGQGTIKGTLQKPYVSGKIALNNGTVMGDIPVTLEQLQATAIIEGESLKLNGSWQSGQQGRASLTGDVNWGNGINLNMAVQAKHLPVIVAPYANLEAGTNLKLQLQDNVLSVAGTVDIPKGAIKVRDLPPSTVKVSPDAVIVTQQNTTEKLPVQLNMDVTVAIGEERLSFQGFGLSSDITGHLSITKNLFTQGIINLNEGIYRAYGQRLEISRARILFTGSLTEPNLDIEAIRVVDDVTAGLRVTGPTSQPQVEIFSKPPMNQDQALSYIVFGRPLSAGDNSVLAQAAFALGVAGGSQIAGQAASKLGIQDFQLDAAGSGDNTSVVASGKITDALSVHYGVNVFKAMNTLMFRYKLTKTVYLEAASGTASSLDIFYKRSFK